MNCVKKFVFLAWIGYGLGVLMHAVTLDAAVNTSAVALPGKLMKTLRLPRVYATEYNRMLMFKEPIPDKALPGDVIRSEKVADEGSCRVKCYLEPNCVAINVGPADVGGRTCELKKFTDESPSHSALEERKDYIHYAVENFCQNSPCPGKNSLCQVGFTDKGYRCVCRDGYKGDQCNDDVDECIDGSHNCGHPSNCENVPGSFHCVCKPDFINDGTKCEAAASTISSTATTSSTATFSSTAKTSLTASTTLSSTHSTTSSIASTSSPDSTISLTTSTLSWAGSGASSTVLTQPTPSANVCFNEPVGVANIRIIHDNQMTASSTKIGYSYKSKYGRLTETRGRGWCAKRCCESQDWLKVDLGKTFQICGVATQGVSEWNNWPVWWLTDFRLSYSTNGGNWTMCKDRNGLNMSFHRSNGGNTVDRHILPVPVLANYIRFHPTKQHNWNCLRVEVYGTAACISGIGSLSGYCYILFTKRDTWNNAQAKCKTLGTELVKIESAEENDFIKTTFLSSSSIYWIGLNDQVHENEWKWTDGSLLSNGNYSNWGDKNPNNSGNQDCVQIVRGYIRFSTAGDIYYDGQWNDKACRDSKGFICKKTN